VSVRSTEPTDSTRPYKPTNYKNEANQTKFVIVFSKAIAFALVVIVGRGTKTIGSTANPSFAFMCACVFLPTESVSAVCVGQWLYIVAATAYSKDVPHGLGHVDGHAKRTPGSIEGVLGIGGHDIIILAILAGMDATAIGRTLG